MRLGAPVLVAGAALCCAGVVGSLAWRAGTPFKGYEETSRTVTIEPGEPARSAALKLQREGIVRSALTFRLLLRLRGAEHRIHAGEYAFEGALTPHQVLDRLLRGEVVRHRLTVVEGLRIDETASLAAAAGFDTPEAFVRAVRRADLIADLDPEARDLEGYLFPDTYFFARGTPADRIVAEMVDRFRGEMAPRVGRARELGMTIRQVVTLASLVEEEARLEEERARIAAVFHNRLRLGMALQCDPTVIYALVRDGRYRGAIYRSDLRYRSPYNTYVTPGLPPGPICSPGARSLDAALHPAPTDDLYFVVSGPGRHVFSTNAGDHARAVQRYRREIEAPLRRR